MLATWTRVKLSCRNFSNGKPVESIDTEKSRIILHELEPGWWILATIDLTRLPKTQTQAPKDTPHDDSIDYSSREVAPPQLLLRYLQRAHSIFLLHHAVSLGDLHARLSRGAFCDLLDRFWSRFIWNWDVLLHGNPSVDIYNGVKLAAGGELGIGVGEEEWGSGEREVLEDFVSRTEGLVDLVVARYGDAPVEQAKEDDPKKPGNLQIRQDPWLGTDADPRAFDGVLFSGVGAISRRSLAAVSHWMEWIYKFGEGAYGVGENPSSRHRRRRGRQPQSRNDGKSASGSHAKQKSIESISPIPRHPSDLRRKAMERNASGPNIPPPLIGAVEKSPDKAIKQAKSTEMRHASAGEKLHGAEAPVEDASLFGTDKMIKYLRLGYGSSWTLSPKGLPKTTPPDGAADASIPASADQNVPPSLTPGNQNEEDDADEDRLQEIEPTPEISDSEEVPFVQRLEQSIGRFIIGLSGDLEDTEMLDDEPDDHEQASTAHVPKRVFLRTLHLELAEMPAAFPTESQEDDNSNEQGSSRGSANHQSSVAGSGSYFGSHKKLQVAVYVHQPFIFAFLFSLHTGMLTFPSFYRNIHHQLGPLQRPLLRSTDPAKVARRIADAVGERFSTTTSADKADESGGPQAAETIFDIVFDPDKLTVRTSIPNVPRPGSIAAEGLSALSRNAVTVSGSWYTLGIPISNAPLTMPVESEDGALPSQWTRVEALNVHTQILNTWIATHDESHGESRRERERTVKTGRGWWVLWMRVPSYSNYGIENDKEAFLVRKATDYADSAQRKEAGSIGGGSRWLLREQTGEASGSGSGSRTGGGTTAGVSEGVGVDARKWIDGLLSLSR